MEYEETSVIFQLITYRKQVLKKKILALQKSRTLVEIILVES